MPQRLNELLRCMGFGEDSMSIEPCDVTTSGPSELATGPIIIMASNLITELRPLPT